VGNSNIDDDTVSGILALAADDFAGPVNIGGPDEMRVLALAEMIRELAGADSPIEFVPRSVDDPRGAPPGTSLALRRLGCQPVVRWKRACAARSSGSRPNWARRRRLPVPRPATAEVRRPGAAPGGDRPGRGSRRQPRFPAGQAGQTRAHTAAT
jgi:hypothetical protein